MIHSLRKTYNLQFTAEKYAAVIDGLEAATGVRPPFRIAETPVFVPRTFKQQLLEAGEAIIKTLQREDFPELTENAIPADHKVPHENSHSQFIIIDFAVTRNDVGELSPQLIELQGFPSLFGFQPLLADQYRAHMELPEHFDSLGGGLNKEAYASILRKTILGKYDPEEVVLLEVLPDQQKTLIDFKATQQLLGIPVLCVSALIQEGKKLYYEKDGRKIRIQRIYNRMIFEDLVTYKAQLGHVINFQQELDVEWAPHPNWYYRISKYLLPYIQGPFAPKAWFLHELPVLPQDLEKYVLKPLFSFAGQGVIIDPTAADIAAITDPENWILQQKVEYAPAIGTPTGPAKCEIRLMYCWPDDAAAPVLVNNLARLSKGKMIGVNFNADKDWVGGSNCFFEP